MPSLSARIWDAYQEEGSIRRLGLLPPANKEVVKAIVPPGGEWRCVVEPGAITRSVVWNQTEVCLVNARGDLNDTSEGQIAMALRATPAMDMALRAIYSLAGKPENLELIQDVARAAIAYVEMDAPPVREPDEDEEALAEGFPC